MLVAFESQRTNTAVQGKPDFMPARLAEGSGEFHPLAGQAAD
jgi:hypothetical protein